MSRDTVQAAIDSGAQDLTTIETATKAGTGCGSCRRDIEGNVGSTTAVTAGSKGRIAMLKQIGAVAKPIIDEAEEQGGSIELWDLQGTAVCLRLGGRWNQTVPYGVACWSDLSVA